jgi:1-acyl-sn-glycerol-3-phosphate acyltransferase
MARKIICAVLRLILRVFFQRIEVAGLDRVPRTGPLMFVLNHPNALVDPAFILCLAPRDVSFLAKEPLFRIPVISFFVRALDSLPVYRRQDEGADVSKNRESFELARALLIGGGTIAICPEGISHNAPKLMPLKTGAARIALGAASTGDGLEMKIVPAGLYYTSKKSFRSSALLYFGEPIIVERTTLEKNGEPSRDAVSNLSAKIETALRDVILNAEHDEALQTIERAERIFSSDRESSDKEGTLARQLPLRQQFIEGYAFHRARSPERLARLLERIRIYENELGQARLDPHELVAPPSLGVAAYHVLLRIVLFLFFLPFAVVGVIVHYPAYRLAGFLSKRFSENSDEMISTIKILASTLLFPVTWSVVGLLAGLFAGWRLAFVAIVAAPILGYVAMRFFEELDESIGAARVLVLFATQERFFKRLLVERRIIQEEIIALGFEASSHADQ